MRRTTALIQVTSFHAGALGGGILIGVPPGAAARPLLRARISAAALPRTPMTGEIWRVSGTVETFDAFNPGKRRAEPTDQIAADWAAPVALRGSAVRRWIAQHPNIRGVGAGYAERLWDAYGPSLYEILRKRDVAALAAVLDASKAAAIVDAFGLLVDEISALEELDDLGLDGRTANAAIRLFGLDAGRRFRDDPYLLTLLEPWSRVDVAALSSGLSPDDPRRLLAAVDLAAARAFRTTGSNLGGHTVVRDGPMRRQVAAMLGQRAAGLADAAIALALREGVIKEIAAGHYQARAPAHMEREIENAVIDRLGRQRAPMDGEMIASVIDALEREDGIRLASEQRDAVYLALGWGFSVITGFAGTGKSTVVKAIRQAHLRAKRGDYVQIALSGRAAKRLCEATGGEAMTIYRYLKDLELGKLSMRRGLLVIDEFSMVGTPDLWLLLTETPREVDVVLVGDPAQLPPIKAGNPAESLVASRSVPQVTLRLPQRQAMSTGIPQIADRIRDGVLPDLPTFDPDAPDRPGVFIWTCGDAQVPGCVIQAFAALAGPPAQHADDPARAGLHRADVQVLAMTRRGPAGTHALGEAIERRWMAAQPPVHDWGFRVGSKLLWTRNAYDRPTGRPGPDGAEETVDIMNGALGVIAGVTRSGAEARFDDGTLLALDRADLANVLRGWTITVHKAQGSAFASVIIPVVASRMLDRAMLYTAVTRARRTAVIVGDPARIAEVVAAPPMVRRRMQALDIDRAAAARKAVD